MMHAFRKIIYNQQLVKYSRIGERFFAQEIYCPDSTLPKEKSILRSKKEDLPPLIYHIRTEKKWTSLKEMVQFETKLSDEYIDELFFFGAIFLETATPNPTTKKATPVERNERKSPRGLVRCTRDCPVDKDLYCRVHVNPRRYILPPVDWQHRLFPFHHGRYLMVNKVSGLPTAESVDNRIECTNFQINDFLTTLQSNNPLTALALTTKHQTYICTSRLDACTSGLLVFSNSSRSAANYHRLMKQQQIHKFYKALTYSPLPLGSIQHLFPKSGTSLRSSENDPLKHRNAKPTLLRRMNDGLTENDESRWKLAEMIVLESKPRPFSSLESSLQQVIRQDPFNPYVNELDFLLYENTIQLITGRTHQIRLQCAALGSAIVGDSRYQPVNGLVYKGKSTFYGDGSHLFGREPKRIGLACFRLEIPLTLFSQVERESSLDIPPILDSSIQFEQQNQKLIFQLKQVF